MSQPILTRSAQAVLDDLLQQAVARADVPFAVLMVANRHQVLYRRAVGTSPDSLFRLASMLKPVTSVTMLMLAERGLLDLDDRLEQYLPDYAGRAVMDQIDLATGEFTARPAATPITLRHLLSHTAGFAYAFNSAETNAMSQRAHYRASARPLLHDPGARWTYGDSTAILGKVVERVTGEKCYAFQQTHIYQPLGMTDSGHFLAEKDAARLNPACNRTVNGDIAQQTNTGYTPYLGADGGLLGTAGDYIRFLQMLLNGGSLDGVRILSEASVRELLRNQLGNQPIQTQVSAQPALSCDFPLGAGADGFSLGFQLKAQAETGKRAPGSFSWGGIHNTHFWGDPQHGLAVVLLTQLLPFYDARCVQLLCDVEREVYAHLTTG